jgi:hypothetical protein
MQPGDVLAAGRAAGEPPGAGGGAGGADGGRVGPPLPPRWYLHEWWACGDGHSTTGERSSLLLEELSRSIPREVSPPSQRVGRFEARFGDVVTSRSPVSHRISITISPHRLYIVTALARTVRRYFRAQWWPNVRHFGACFQALHEFTLAQRAANPSTTPPASAAAAAAAAAAKPSRGSKPSAVIGHVPGVTTKSEKAVNPEALTGLLGGYGSGSDNEEDGTAAGGDGGASARAKAKATVAATVSRPQEC